MKISALTFLNKEQLLVRRAQLLGDNGAYSSLVQMHQGKIRAFLMRLTRDHDRADDLAQDTFIKAFQKLSSFKGKGSFSGWLFSIAYRCFLEQLRSKSRREEVISQYSTVVELQEDRYESISDQQLDLERALAQLKPEEAAAITLCFSFGFSNQETAEILQTPLGTIKTNIFRGKDKLRELLDEEKSAIKFKEKVS